MATNGWHKVLDRLEEVECIQLLEKAGGLSKVSRNDEDKAITLLRALGFHTLAILHAGSYIANSHITVAQYLDWLRTHRKRILGNNSTVQGNLSVYATIEVSMKFLDQSGRNADEETNKDAFDLLTILSTFHHERVPLDFLRLAWKGRKKAFQTPAKLQMHSCRLTAWHADQVPDFLKAKDEEVGFRIVAGVRRLESLALVRTDATPYVWKSVSMHPLVHSWARDRQSKEEQQRSVRMTECLVALSESIRFNTTGCWNPYHGQFGPHIKRLVALDLCLINDAAQQRCVLQIYEQIAWTYARIGLMKDLCEFTDQIFQRLGLDLEEPKEELRGLYVVFAYGVQSGKSRAAEGVTATEAIARLDSKTLKEDDILRLDNLESVGFCYIVNGQIEKGIATLEKVIKSCKQFEMDELAASAQSALAMALIQDGRISDAWVLLEELTRTPEHFAEYRCDRPWMLCLLAFARFQQGKFPEFTQLLEKLNRHFPVTFGEEHPYVAKIQRALAVIYLASGRIPELNEISRLVHFDVQMVIDIIAPALVVKPEDVFLTTQSLSKLIASLEWMVERCEQSSRNKRMLAEKLSEAYYIRTKRRFLFAGTISVIFAAVLSHFQFVQSFRRCLLAATAFSSFCLTVLFVQHSPFWRWLLFGCARR